MANKMINVTISPEGGVVFDTEGFVGNECKDATKKLEQAVGAASDVTLKPEYYLQNQKEEEEIRIKW